MQVSEQNCKGCPVFEDSQHNGISLKTNMIKNNICHKRELVGCAREEIQQQAMEVLKNE